MTALILTYLSKHQRGSVTTGGLMLVVVLGLVDWLTGYEVSFALFYLVPIALVVWVAGRRAGFVIAVSSVLSALLADWASGHRFTHALIPLWNAAMRFGFFTIAILMLSKLHETQAQLAHNLREANMTIRVLKGLIPICSWCKKIRDDQGYWQQVETYIQEHSEASFTHAICPACREGVEAELETLGRPR